MNEEKKPKTSGVIALMLIIAVVVCFLYLWQHVETVRLGYQIAKLEKTKRELMDERKRIELEISTILNYEKLQAVAPKLGLHLANSEEIIYITFPEEEELAKK